MGLTADAAAEAGVRVRAVDYDLGNVAGAGLRPRRALGPGHVRSRLAGLADVRDGDVGSVAWVAMSRMASAVDLAKQAEIMEDAGAVRVRQRFRRPAHHGDVLDPGTQNGMHAHETLLLPVANAVIAVGEGVTRVDASLAGQGVGVGTARSKPSPPSRNLSCRRHNW